MKKYLPLFLLIGIVICSWQVTLASTQIYLGRISAPFNTTSTATRFMGPGTNTAGNTETNMNVVVPTTSTLSLFNVVVDVAPSGTTATLLNRFRIGAANGNSTCSIIDQSTTCQDSTNTDVVSPGQLIDLSTAISNSPFNTSTAMYSFTLTPTVTDEQIFNFISTGLVTATGTIGFGELQGLSSGNTTRTNRRQVVSQAGTFKYLYSKYSAAPAGSSVRTVTLELNNATTSLACTTTGAATTCNDTADTVAVVAGDIVDIRQDVSTANAAAAQGEGGIVFVPTTAGQGMFLANYQGAAGNSTVYMNLNGSDIASVGTEAFSKNYTHATATLKTMYVALQNAPAGVTSRTITLRQNGVDTAIFCTVTGAATTCSNTTSSVSVLPGDTLDYSLAVSGAPVGSRVAVSIGYTIPTSNPVAGPAVTSTIFIVKGVQFTVKGQLTIK